MKVTVNRKAFLDCVKLVTMVGKNRMPKLILQCVRITARGNELAVSATDLEIAILARTAQVQVEQEGEALVNCRKLMDIINVGKDDTVSLEVATDKESAEVLEIRGGCNLSKIYCGKLSEFPSIPMASEVGCQIEQKSLATLMKKTSFAASKENARYIFNGTMATFKNGQLKMVGTDGARLAICSVEAKTEKEGFGIIPLSVLKIIAKLPKDAKVTMGFTPHDANDEGGMIHIKTEDVSIVANQACGKFPPYEDCVPKGHDTELTVSTKDFLDAVEIASSVCNEGSPGIRLDIGEKGITLSGRSAQFGDSIVNFPCRVIGPARIIGFNAEFLIQFLKSVDGDEFTLGLTTPNRPGLFISGSSQYVLMPVNL